MHAAAWSISCLLPRGLCWAQLLCLGYLKEYLVLGEGVVGCRLMTTGTNAAETQGNPAWGLHQAPLEGGFELTGSRGTEAKIKGLELETRTV